MCIHVHMLCRLNTKIQLFFFFFSFLFSKYIMVFCLKTSWSSSYMHSAEMFLRDYLISCDDQIDCGKQTHFGHYQSESVSHNLFDHYSWLTHVIYITSINRNGHRTQCKLSGCWPCYASDQIFKYKYIGKIVWELNKVIGWNGC